MKRLCVVVVILCLAAAGALAHSGRTDSKGGHYNRSTGEYHYHHGLSAHDHPGGVCPYEKKATPAPRQSTGSSFYASSFITSATARPTFKPAAKLTTKPTASATGKGDQIMHWGICVLFAIGFFNAWAKSKQKERELQAEKRNVSLFKERLAVSMKETADAKAMIEEKVKLADQATFDKQIDAEHYREVIASLKTELSKAQASLSGSEDLIKSFFENISLRELSGMPRDTVIGIDGLPKTTGATRGWGEKYTRYISGYGSDVYHRKDCRYGCIPVHVCSSSLPKRQAQCCFPEAPPDLKWYRNYLQFKAYCESKGITPTPDNVSRFAAQKQSYQCAETPTKPSF